MEYRPFGTTDLRVSEVGFGAWGIGGGVKAGRVPIGWGDTDDRASVRALQTAFDRGVNFFDTADFYGLGRSETLLGETFGNRSDVLIASKVGHRLDRDRGIYTDYSTEYIMEACEKSLFRLQRETIDLYQLHTAKVSDLDKGACLEAMNRLREQGKIRYWGLSLNTFAPNPEADWMMEHGQGHGIQLVLNLINQRTAPLLSRLKEEGFGIIARMPLQFGLLTGKFQPQRAFPENDHRSFRLPSRLLACVQEELEPVKMLAGKYGLGLTGLALSFILAFPEVSTVIPGMKTADQVIENTGQIRPLAAKDREALQQLYAKRWAAELMPLLEAAG